jgi:hypothetical protein
MEKAQRVKQQAQSRRNFFADPLCLQQSGVWQS